jgi:hypothetical protein
MDIRIWSVLHDGGIEGFTGEVPGDLVMDVGSLAWLIEECHTSTDLLKVVLKDCDRVEFEESDSKQRYVGMEQLQKLNLDQIEILSASEAGDIVEVVTTGGVLRIRYSHAKIYLDDGKEVTQNQLEVAVNAAVEKWRGLNDGRKQ